MPPVALEALRALHDCGVIRARTDHPGFSYLIMQGMAKAKPIRLHVWDFRLTSYGKQQAQERLTV